MKDLLTADVVDYSQLLASKSSTDVVNQLQSLKLNGVLGFQGMINGLRTPSVRLNLSMDLSDAGLKNTKNALLCFVSFWGKSFPTFASSNANKQLEAINLLTIWLDIVSDVLAGESEVLSVHVLDRPKHAVSLEHSNGQKLTVDVFWPTHWPVVLGQLLLWLVNFWQLLTTQLDYSWSETSMSQRQQAWKQLMNKVAAQLPSGVNWPHLLAALYRLQKPVKWLEVNLLQVGVGKHARLMRSTMTDGCSSLGVSIARDKTRATRLLGMAGIPVPKHYEVHSVEEAVQVTTKLRWPLVVKPADLDRGDGARAGLRNLDQLKEAYRHARSLTRRVLIEEHVQGAEYRLTVVNGCLVWAHERIPASIIGDGVSSISLLVARENEKRQQSLLANPVGWMPILLDQDCLSYLAEQGLSKESIPQKGEEVRLQRVPAATTGGLGKAFFEVIHPDNRLLAEKSAELLRLEIAGIDFITTDITKSWRDVGGCITEINAAPQISIQTNPGLIDSIVDKLFPGFRRVPVWLVIAEDSKLDANLAFFIKQMVAEGYNIGVHSSDGLKIGSRFDRQSVHSLWRDVAQMQVDVAVDAIVVVTDGVSLLKTGLPFDKVDGLLLTHYAPKLLPLISDYVSDVFCIGRTLFDCYYPVMKEEMRATCIIFEKDEFSLLLNQLERQLISSNSINKKK